MRILAVDFGDSRTGTALSDRLGITAQPLGTIFEKNLTLTAQRVAALAQEHEASTIVVGFPKNMNNTVGERGERTLVFVKALRSLTDTPVELYDERLTTASARHALNATNTRGARRKQVIDTASAVVLLQDYLRAMQNKKSF